jgi:glycosyltransferase involved in cell wall biosynthesis
MVRVSVVTTVKNEENTILQLLSSLENQSLKPYEIIIVDGGSEDRTPEIIKSFIGSKDSFRFMLIDDMNRAQGRNKGISAAVSDIVACTDAGVVLDRFWLENLVKPITNGRADFVGGVYVQRGGSLFQECVGILQYPNLEKLRDNDFLPSSRSVAFKKTVWKSVGGYPESLEKAEDTLFDLTVKEKKFRVALAKDAIVYWPARDTLKSLFLQYSSYADWDMKAGLFLEVKTYRLMILAYIVLAFSLLSIFAFGLWSFLLSFSVVSVYMVNAGIKALRKTRKLLSFFIAIAVKITIFSAETFGIMKGVSNRVTGAKHKGIVKKSKRLRNRPNYDSVPASETRSLQKEKATTTANARQYV